MTVEDFDKIDFADIDRESGNVNLTISDHLDWNENKGEHLLALQNKLNSYLEFVESGQIYVKLPSAIGRQINIRVI
jgi:hypothetical protein